MSNSQSSSKALPTRSARPQFGSFPTSSNKNLPVAPRSTTPAKPVQNKVKTTTPVAGTERAPKTISADKASTITPLASAVDVKAIKTSGQILPTKPRAWSQVMATPPTETSSYQKAPPVEKARSTVKAKDDKATAVPDATLSKSSKTTEVHGFINTTPEQALSQPESHFHDKAIRVNNIIHDVYDKYITFSEAALKHGFSSVEEAGVALAVFALQEKQLLKARKVYKETLLLAMAKNKDGYAAGPMDKSFTDAWNQRKDEDEEKARKGLKRTEGQARARQDGRDWATERMLEMKRG